MQFTNRNLKLFRPLVRELHAYVPVGLTVDQFQRRTSVVEYSRASLKKALKTVKKFAELEGLGAHGNIAEVRLK